MSDAYYERILGPGEICGNYDYYQGETCVLEKGHQKPRTHMTCAGLPRRRLLILQPSVNADDGWSRMQTAPLPRWNRPETWASFAIPPPRRRRHDR